MKKRTYIIIVIIPLVLYYLYSLKNTLDENYFAFTILILGCIIFINKVMRERKKFKNEQLFLPIFVSTLTLGAVSLFYILIHKETNMIVILSDILLISLGGLAYYLLKTMQP